MYDFVQISGFPNNYITQEGHVYSTQSGRMRKRKNYKAKNGYEYIMLYRTQDGAKVKDNFLVHRLVYQAFVGPLLPDMVVCHIDGVRDSNRPENLLQATQKVNCSHKKMHGTHVQGEHHHHAKFSNAQLSQVLDSIKNARRTATGQLGQGEVPRIATVCAVSESSVYVASMAYSRNNGLTDLNDLRKLP